MDKMTKKIRCAVMRGGTSRGLFFRLGDLPEDNGLWPSIFCRALGTPDPRQTDGLGGGTSSTSKIAVVDTSVRAGIDVDYTFIQIGVRQEVFDASGNCGNISSAVAPFAVDEGLVKAIEPFTMVNIHNTNTSKRIRATIKVKHGLFDPTGDCAIPGIPQKGSAILMEYFEPEGAMTGSLFPTGNLIDTVEVDGSTFKITVVDCTNPYVFIAADEIGLGGTELPSEIDASQEMVTLQRIRHLAGEMIGLKSPAFPKVSMVSQPKPYFSSTAERVDAGSIDIVARTVSMGATHNTVPLTGAFSLAASLVIPGTIPASLCARGLPSGSNEIAIGHPGGIIRVGVEKQVDAGGESRIVKVSSVRTARRIMEGYALM